MFPCIDGTIPNPLLGVAGGWGWWLIKATVVIVKALLHRLVATTINFPPQLRPQASHPTYSLLGFSAALAPKFTNHWDLKRAFFTTFGF